MTDRFSRLTAAATKIAGGVAGTAEITDDQLLVRVAQLKLGFEPRVVEEALSQAIAEKDDALVVLWSRGSASPWA